MLVHILKNLFQLVHMLARLLGPLGTGKLLAGGFERGVEAFKLGTMHGERSIDLVETTPRDFVAGMRPERGVGPFVRKLGATLHARCALALKITNDGLGVFNV